MALSSKCPSCSGTTFENAGAKKIAGYQYKLNFIRCTKCGAVAGVLPYADLTAVAERDAKEFKELKAELEQVKAMVGVLAKSLRR